MYPFALDAGIPQNEYWELSLNEIFDRMESYGRREEKRRKEKIEDNFILAQVIALNTAEILFTEKDKQPRFARPWEFYPELFDQEKDLFEKIERERELEEYKEQRRNYIREFNNRRQQGL